MEDREIFGAFIKEIKKIVKLNLMTSNKLSQPFFKKY